MPQLRMFGIGSCDYDSRCDRSCWVDGVDGDVIALMGRDVRFESRAEAWMPREASLPVA